MNIKGFTLISLLMLAVSISSCATPNNGEKWNCTANGIVSGYYNGGDYAYIHLQGFEYGGNYAATKNSANNRATGKTKNGTVFECRKS